MDGTARMQVELVCYMSSDLGVVNAARASFGKESEWEVAGYTEETDTGSRIVMEWPEYKLSDKDAKLIRYLAPGIGIVEVGYLIQEWDTDPDEEHVEEND